MSGKGKALSWFTGLLGGEYIAKKGVDRQILFIFFCFILVSLYLMWGLWVEDRMALINKNDKIIEELQIEFHEKDLQLTGLDQRTRIEKMLLQGGNTSLHAPEDPPQRIVIE
ncbi:MAG: hypothetical protein IJS30_00110 [Bacteroidales bacterium]|nr:hypothetical protein [Bacteroidales bacterium]